MKAVYEWGGVGPWPGGALLVYLARAVSILEYQEGASTGTTKPWTGR
jgi:hypothetical protein